MTRRTILGIFAHPDDESMGPGGSLASYATRGHRVAFVTATEGGAGRLYDTRPEVDTDLRAIRCAETTKAAEILGIESLGFLGWPDGDLRRMDVLEIEEALAAIIRRERPDVVVTFHGSGISYHPDHRVLTLAVGGAFRGAARAGWYRSDALRALEPHRASKLYHAVVGNLRGVEWPRDVYVAPSDEITTIIDTRDVASVRWRAIAAHESQRNGPPFDRLYETGAFEQEMFVRIVPTPSTDEPIETDLLAGLDA